MNFKTLLAAVLLIGFTFSMQAQTLIATEEEWHKKLEEKAERQSAAEKADPTLSKNRPGRIQTKAEKAARQKSKKAKNKKLAKALKSIQKQNGGKLKITTSKSKRNQPTKEPTKQPTKGAIKKIKN